MHTGFGGKNIKGRDHLEEAVLDMRMVQKRIFNTCKYFWERGLA